MVSSFRSMWPGHSFQEPPWQEPLDTALTLQSIPASATIAGMYPNAIAEGAKQLGKVVPLLRERYLPFGFYPLREYVELLLQACEVLYPKRPLRFALRSTGRAAPAALLKSTMGRVVFGSVNGPREVMHSLIKTYPINLRPCHAEILESSDQHVLVHLRDIHFFLDCHHVGVLEGALRHAKVTGKVLISSLSATEAHLRCTWA